MSDDDRSLKRAAVLFNFWVNALGATVAAGIASGSLWAAMAVWSVLGAVRAVVELGQPNAREVPRG